MHGYLETNFKTPGRIGGFANCQVPRVQKYITAGRATFSSNFTSLLRRTKKNAPEYSCPMIFFCSQLFFFFTVSIQVYVNLGRLGKYLPELESQDKFQVRYL